VLRAQQVDMSVLSALSCFGMALCDSLLPAFGIRAMAGIDYGP
jgi:hypothetical protein